MMRLIIHIIILNICLTFSNTHAQDFTSEEQLFIDSLTNVVNTTKHDTVKINTLFELAGRYYSANPDTAIGFCREAEDLSVSINYKYGMSESYGWLGYLYTTKGKNEEAQVYNFKSLEIMEGTANKISIATLHTNIGTIYSKQGNIAGALEHYHQSLKIQEEINDSQGVAHTLTSIGLVYKYQNDVPLALDFYKRSLAIWEEIEDNGGIGLTLNNIGVVYYESKEYDLAMDYYQRSLEKRKTSGDKSGIANSLGNIGTIYEVRGDYKTALEYYNSALELEKEIGSKDGMCQTLFNIAIANYTLGDFKQSKEFAQASFDLATELGYPHRVYKSAELLSKLYRLERNFQKGWEMYELGILMRDSILNEETQKEYLKQEFKYEFEKKTLTDSLENEKKDLEIKEQQAIIKRDEAQMKRDKMQRYALFGGLFLMLILVGVSVRGYLRKRKDNNLISRQKEAVENQKQKIEIQHLKLEETHKEIADSINYAKRIQQAILPSSKQTKELLINSFILYKPKDVVAGDFYWLEQAGDQVLFAAADCTGHGVPGAMVSVVCNNALNRSVREYGLIEPGEILDKAREIVIEEFGKSDEEVKDGMDIALCSLPYPVSSLKKNEGKTIEFKYAGAHNPLWIIRTSPDGGQDGEVIETKADKQPIGTFDKQKAFTTHTIELQEGDVIYVFSDGYVDQFGGDRGKKFKTKAFRKLLLSIQDKSMETQRELIDSAFETWRGDLEQIDDVCVIGVRV